MSLDTEIQKRRSFAIISHPDAGKTTITEKLLLFGGAIQMAGTVRARKAKRYATSDWMEIEKQRGISVTSSVMKFVYQNYEINLLDTPGHQDFSEDTYRVLTAVDSSLMIIDGVKGVESQTIKLLDVCRMRHTPVMTFMNKFDRECKDPFDLLDEIEKILKIQAAPVTWPIGSGKEFKGVYNLVEKKVEIFKAGEQKANFESLVIEDIQSSLLEDTVGDYHATKLREDLELLEAGTQFNLEDYLKGTVTPVFFGSAMNNFGVQELLHHFIKFAPAPKERASLSRIVKPEEDKFSGFIFKIQANMDPSHRDRIAFFRICSGKFKKGMKAFHPRLGREVKIHKTVAFMAQSREEVEEAYPGDILGLYDSGIYKIGDSLTQGEKLEFKGIPHFAPEHFMKVRLANPLKSKQLHKGLNQLTEEGATQVFRPVYSADPILGVVGVLQFDVIKFRLLKEYGVEGIFESVPYHCARWFHAEENILKKFEEKHVAQIALDAEGKKIFLAGSQWDLDYALKKFETLEFFQNSDHVPVS